MFVLEIVVEFLFHRGFGWLGYALVWLTTGGKVSLDRESTTAELVGAVFILGHVVIVAVVAMR